MCENCNTKTYQGELSGTYIIPKSEIKKSKESFEEFCIRTGHKLNGTQGVDGSKYDVLPDGSVIKKIDY